MRFLPVAILTLVFAIALPASASASKCGAVTNTEGPIATNITTSKTTCTVGRAVARSYATGPFMGKKRAVRDQLGRTWRCRVTQTATGTDPGYVARTKVRCTRANAVVRFEFRS